MFQSDKRSGLSLFINNIINITMNITLIEMRFREISDLGPVWFWLQTFGDLLSGVFEQL